MILSKHGVIGLIVLSIALILDNLIYSGIFIFVSGFMIGLYGTKIDKLKKLSESKGEKNEMQ